MKKRELATHIGVTERSVSGYESGTQEPEPGTLAKIAKTLRFPEAFFLVMILRCQRRMLPVSGRSQR
ncbi:helix-turn-helix transcriptional regulator [Pseudomonas aeruginosa]|uniref:helix-turn-helix domain-containing protein n=1 Tax=Pseudomonas aeruginosa TaxID=287 RepID=UPI0026200E60|nr:helix-turn-helix transcriptional regulator [Pseudomonas aeruginosa]WKA35466.1 helix-turn-helix transcriptional regulator [Pseudomonas aeruginosa]